VREENAAKRDTNNVKRHKKCSICLFPWIIGGKQDEAVVFEVLVLSNVEVVHVQINDEYAPATVHVSEYMTYIPWQG
jgi:hypothetical protein